MGGEGGEKRGRDREKKKEESEKRREEAEKRGREREGKRGEGGNITVIKPIFALIAIFSITRTHTHTHTHTHTLSLRLSLSLSLVLFSACIRPSVPMDSGASNEDDLTMLLVEIVKYNTELKNAFEVRRRNGCWIENLKGDSQSM